MTFAGMSLQIRTVAVVNHLAELSNNLVPMVSGSGGAGQLGWRLAVNSNGDSGHKHGFSQRRNLQRRRVLTRDRQPPPPDVGRVAVQTLRESSPNCAFSSQQWMGVTMGVTNYLSSYFIFIKQLVNLTFRLMYHHQYNQGLRPMSEPFLRWT